MMDLCRGLSFICRMADLRSPSSWSTPVRCGKVSFCNEEGAAGGGSELPHLSWPWLQERQLLLTDREVIKIRYWSPIRSRTKDG